jgi:hypothetical protein
MEKMDNVKGQVDHIKSQALGRLRKMTVYNWVMVVIGIIAIVLALVLNPAFLLILVLLAFAGPLVREVGLLDERDERISFISYRSSHIAFYVTMLVITALFIARTLLVGKLIEPEYFILLTVPVLYKFFASLALAYDTRLIAIIIGYTAGVLIGVMVALEGYLFAPQMFVPLLIILVTVIAHWMPKLAGSLFLLLGMGYLVMIARSYSGDKPLQLILLALILGVPVILAGTFLLFHKRMAGAGTADFKEEIPKETGK